MELTVAQVSAAKGVTPQYVRRAISSGDLVALRQVGPTVIVDDLAVQVWDRSRARGRRWTDEVRNAAFELLDEGGTARLSSSERSRLRANLRGIQARNLAHLAGGLGGGWARYRRTAESDGLVEVNEIGLTPAELADLGLTGGVLPIRFVSTASLEDFELDNSVVLDAFGDVGVVERTDVGGRTRALLDTYLLGGARESAVAAAEIERMARAL